MSTIRGRVIDTEVDEGIGFIRVELRTPDGVTLQVTATGSEGIFEFRDVEPDKQYTVIALSPIHVPSRYVIKPKEIVKDRTTRIELRTHKAILSKAG